MEVLLTLVTALVPLVILPGILFHYDIIPKVVLLALMVAAIILTRPRSVAGELGALWGGRTGRWLCLIATAQIVWFGVTTALSSRPWFSLFGTNWRRMGLPTVLALALFTVLAAAHFRSKPQTIARVLRASAVAAMIASLYGILQYFDIDPLQPASAYHAQAGDSTIVRPPGTLGHADYFAWWLAIAFFCSIALIRIETRWWRVAGVIAGILAAVAILFTGTRAAMLGVAAGLVSLALMSRIRFRKQHAAALALIVASLGAFYVSPAGARLRARVKWSADEPLGGARPLLWRDSLRMIAARPLFGFGPETFPSEFPRYQSVELARQFPDFYHESPHNSALDILTGEGVFGLLIAFGWVALAGYTAFRAGRKQGALLSALVASCVVAMFTALTLGPLFATALVIAMIVGSESDRVEAGARLRWQTVFAFSAPLALGLAAYSFMLVAADFRLEVFHRNSNSGHYEKTIAASLRGAAEDVYCSRRLSQTCGRKCADVAFTAATRATITDDFPPNAWYNLAVFTAPRGDAKGVETALRTSIALAPNWFKPHWALGKLLNITGRASEARKEARLGVFLNAGKDPEVSDTLP